MIQKRRLHGTILFEEKVYTFGGDKRGDDLESAEKYELQTNTWDNLPDLPVAGSAICCIKFNQAILITSENFSLIRFDPLNQEYTQFDIQIDEDIKNLAVVEEDIFLFTDDQTFQLSPNGAVLSVRQSGTPFDHYCDAIFVTEDGTIFGVTLEGEVYSFKPTSVNDAQMLVDLSRV